MNEQQYKIVKFFLGMGIAPERIAKEFKAKLKDVNRVVWTDTYRQFSGDDRDFNVETMLKSMGL